MRARPRRLASAAAKGVVLLPKPLGRGDLGCQNPLRLPWSPSDLACPNLPQHRLLPLARQGGLACRGLPSRQGDPERPELPSRRGDPERRGPSQSLAIQRGPAHPSLRLRPGIPSLRV